MNLKKINEIFGYALFIVGALKVLLVVLVVLQMATSINNIISNVNVAVTDYSLFSKAIGFAQIILALGSIMMIILNIKDKPGVIPGYLLGLGAVVFELIVPPIMSFYAIFVEAGMYMKAGTKIRNKNSGYKEERHATKKMIENTKWFYSEPNTENDQAEQREIQTQKRMDKLKEELDEWEKLLESGEIDEATYREETNKLIEKAHRKGI